MLLPDYLIDPWQLAAQGATLQGQVALAQMGRLRSAVRAHAQWATVNWYFSMIDGQPVIRGSVTADLTVQCQRCLEEMPYQVAGETWLCAVREPYDDRQLPEGFEPAIIEHQQVALSHLVEDELILLLPFAPMHEVCPNNLYCLDKTNEIEEFTQSHHPFAVLSHLKK